MQPAFLYADHETVSIHNEVTFPRAVGEQDKAPGHHEPLWQTLLEFLRNEGAAGATIPRNLSWPAEGTRNAPASDPRRMSEDTVSRIKATIEERRRQGVADPAHKDA